jgi:hypothetical protein
MFLFLDKAWLRGTWGCQNGKFGQLDWPPRVCGAFNIPWKYIATPKRIDVRMAIHILLTSVQLNRFYVFFFGCYSLISEFHWDRRCFCRSCSPRAAYQRKHWKHICALDQTCLMLLLTKMFGDRPFPMRGMRQDPMIISKLVRCSLFWGGY